MPIINIQCSPFKHALSDQELKAVLLDIEAARAFTKMHESALSGAVATADHDVIAKETEVLLGDERVILTSAVAANRKLKPHSRWPLEACLALPDTFSFSAPFPEKVRVRGKKKADKSYRALQDFGLRHRTAQQAILRVMSAHLKPRPFQFTMKGVPAAITRARELVNEGYVYAAHLDITDFFGSFEMEKLLPQLPLPQEVVKHAVVGRYMEHVLADNGTMKSTAGKGMVGNGGKTKPLLHRHYGSTTVAHEPSLLSQARLGIPQGSICAPIIGAFCMAHLEWKSQGVALLNYADDFLLLSKEKAALQKGIATLVDAVSNLPGGSFSVKLKCERCLDQGVCFLGHELHIKNGELKVWPSYGHLENLLASLDAIERKLGPMVCLIGAKSSKTAVLAELAHYHAITSGFKTAFSACDDLKRYLSIVDDAETKWIEAVGVSMENIVAAVTPDMEFAPSTY